MPKVSEAHKQRKRLQIVDTALYLFSIHGIKSTTIQMISDRSGMSFGSIYNYFKKKEDIVEAAVGYSVEVLSRDGNAEGNDVSSAIDELMQRIQDLESDENRRSSTVLLMYTLSDG